MDLSMIALLSVFALAAVILHMSRTERHLGVFFLIRSGIGIRLIDRLAKCRPRLWEIMADVSVLLSFGGLGAYYLSSHSSTRNNLYRGIFAIGVLFSLVSVFRGMPGLAVTLFVLGYILALVLPRAGSTAQ